MMLMNSTENLFTRLLENKSTSLVIYAQYGREHETLRLQCNQEYVCTL